MFNLGISIQTGLVRKKMKQTELAKIMMVSPQYVNRLCTGNKKTSLDKIMWFAEFFDVPLSTFILWGE